jgi:hypothetical protein
MNRRDAIKAAVAGVATCALPAIAQAEAERQEPTLTDIEGWYVYRYDGDRLHDMTAKFSDGSTFKVRTDVFDAKWFVSLIGQPKNRCVMSLMQGHTYWTCIYGDRWTPAALRKEA